MKKELKSKEKQYSYQRNPIHPGEILNECFIKPLNLELDYVAGKLKIPTSALTKIIEGSDDITPQLASKLSKLFKNSKKFWLNMQDHYDQNKFNR